MNIDLTQILFQIVNFGVVLGVLWYLLYKPVLKIFAERAKRIEEGQKAAQEALANEAKIDEIKQKTEQELKKKSSQVLKEATVEAEKQKAVLMEEARAAATAEIAKMKQSWQAEKAQLIQNINTQVVDVVITATQKVVGKSMDTKSHSKLIDEELSNLLKSI